MLFDKSLAIDKTGGQNVSVNRLRGHAGMPVIQTLIKRLPTAHVLLLDRLR
jgi:hypothetical protein